MPIIRASDDPNAPLIDLNLDFLLEHAAKALAIELAKRVDSGHAPGGSRLPPIAPASLERRERAGQDATHRGHRTGQIRKRWRARRVRRGASKGMWRVDIKFPQFRAILGQILGGADPMPDAELLARVAETGVAKAIKATQRRYGRTGAIAAKMGEFIGPIPAFRGRGPGY